MGYTWNVLLAVEIRANARPVGICPERIVPVVRQRFEIERVASPTRDSHWPERVDRLDASAFGERQPCADQSKPARGLLTQFFVLVVDEIHVTQNAVMRDAQDRSVKGLINLRRQSRPITHAGAWQRSEKWAAKAAQNERVNGHLARYRHGSSDANIA